MNMKTPDLDRRGALALLGAGAAPGILPGGALAKSLAGQPWLATPEQIRAERMVVELLRDAEIKRIQGEVRAELAGWPRARLPDAAATLDRAIAQWTHSLIFAEFDKNIAQPAFLWGTDDTPRTWMGHTLGGVGTSGDNPDAIYRTAGIEGGVRYEIVGRWHPESRPVQLIIQTDAADRGQPVNNMATAGGSHADRRASLLTDADLHYEPDGSFRITLSPEPTGGANHLVTHKSGLGVVGVRDMLSDWKQRAAALTIRRLDPVQSPKPFGIEELRRHVRADLAGYIRFWAKFPDLWFGGIKPNTHSEPLSRPGGGFGYISGLNFHLAPDEAMIVTTWPGAARYTGFQLTDPWMIAPDARTHQVCLNNSQVTPSPDGTVTYVIASRDPGAANWLDTGGLQDGIGIVRWQQVPPGMDGSELIREFRVAKLGEIAEMQSFPRVTPAERQRQIAARAPAYNTRVS